MATQDAFKNEMSEENLVDAGLAAIFGWTDIEQTDFGAVVGKSPETCCTENIPRPSKNIASFHTVLSNLLKSNQNQLIRFNVDFLLQRECPEEKAWFSPKIPMWGILRVRNQPPIPPGLTTLHRLIPWNSRPHKSKAF